MIPKGKSLKEKIVEQKPFIFWAEIAAILHDIGKLSETFLKYRQEWRKWQNGWDKDPHDHDFLSTHDNLIKESQFRTFKEWLDKEVKVEISDENISIAEVVHRHIDPEDSTFLKMIKAADGKDAALDRNNPLFTADQIKKIYDTDVFGAEDEENIIEPSKVEKCRKDLYQELSLMELPDGSIWLSWTEREALLNTIRRHFDKGPSDTTRPDNDTSLWEHCYAVASIFKVIIVHRIIYGKELDDFAKVRFGIWGIGWDGLAYLSMGHKIGDIIGRKARIDQLGMYQGNG